MGKTRLLVLCGYLGATPKAVSKSLTFNELGV